jgi:hypothetical protein
MNFGTAIASIVIGNYFDERRRAKNSLRPERRSAGTRTRSRSGQRGSNSFAEHPERW